MRPQPRILLETAAAAVSEFSGDVVHFSPPPVSASPPKPPPCVAHACRWWPYSGSKEFEANAAMVLIILLSALICALGLNSAIRCVLRSTHLVDDEELNHRRSRRNSQELTDRVQLKTNAAAAPAFDGGPTLVYSPEMKAELAGATAECAICLSEFVDGEGIRVLQRCKHGFHSHCIQGWLSTHSSCPTCRSTCLPPSPSPPHPPPQSAEADQPPLPESTVGAVNGSVVV